MGQLACKNMGLSSEHRKKLRNALIDAFPEKSSLEQMLWFELDKNLDVIADGTSLEVVVFKLIKIAEAQNWVENLIFAALRENPGNPSLKAIENGNYNERTEGNYIQANTVNIYEQNGCGTTNNNEQDQSSNKQVHRLVITLDGIDFNKFLSDQEIQAAVSLLLQKASGDTSVNIEKIEKGSIKITLDGSPEGLKRLAALIQSEELGELKEDLKKLGLSIEDVKLLFKDATEENENTEDDEKSLLVQEILGNGVHGRDLSCVDLSNADLRSADLSSANLSGANLINANLSGANLSDAKLCSANLINSNLGGTIFWNADLSDANLGGANFSGTIFWNANLSGSGLNGANLSGAYLDTANLRDANLGGANLNGVDLSGANLHSADLRGADLSSANFRGADLSGANFSGTYFRYVNLGGTILSGADLSDAILSSVDLSDASLRDADLSSANLIGAKLIGTNFSGANVENARFGYNKGISSEMRDDLIRRGAIFEDSPGDRFPIGSPVPSPR